VAKAKPKRDAEREERITMEIVVDAYGADERFTGWWCYLEDTLHFPFTATCIAKRAISPLHVKDKVEVIGMPSEGECKGEMFVTIRWEEDELAVPLAQLKPSNTADQETKQAVADWHYWVEIGHEF
jgi:Calcium binding